MTREEREERFSREHLNEMAAFIQPRYQFTFQLFGRNFIGEIEEAYFSTNDPNAVYLGATVGEFLDEFGIQLSTLVVTEI